MSWEWEMVQWTRRGCVNSKQPENCSAVLPYLFMRASVHSALDHGKVTSSPSEDFAARWVWPLFRGYLVLPGSALLLLQTNMRKTEFTSGPSSPLEGPLETAMLRCSRRQMCSEQSVGCNSVRALWPQHWCWHGENQCHICLSSAQAVAQGSPLSNHVMILWCLQ